MEGELVHYEIPARNPARLSKFYADVLGWKFKDGSTENMKYWLVSANASAKRSMGGMYKKTKAQQTPTNYVSVKNIDAAVRRLQQRGGKVLMPKQAVPRMGWSVMARDPEGNALGLFQVDTKVRAESSQRRRR